jgi:hypothetical protein
MITIHQPKAWIAAALLLIPISQSAASDLMFGCWSRPACGKVCKLVCDETTLTATCYDCVCDQICVPGPSQQGCKHCATMHCGESGCAKCEFCWYDWVSCGCAMPRTVKVLKKYQTERKVCSYHWEVVDDRGCGANGGPGCGCGCVYKAAPVESQIGQAIPVSETDRLQLAAWVTNDAAQRQAELADAFKLPEVQGVAQSLQPLGAAAGAAAGAAEEKPSMLVRFASMFKVGK